MFARRPSTHFGVGFGEEAYLEETDRQVRRDVGVWGSSAYSHSDYAAPACFAQGYLGMVIACDLDLVRVF